jgi:adenosylcobinamide-GDP ribazoletransferase
VPGRPWQGPLAVLTSVFVVLVLLRHLVRRLGGITGDVLGFLLETVTCVVLVSLTLN